MLSGKNDLLEERERKKERKKQRNYILFNNVHESIYKCMIILYRYVKEGYAKDE